MLLKHLLLEQLFKICAASGLGVPQAPFFLYILSINMCFFSGLDRPQAPFFAINMYFVGIRQAASAFFQIFCRLYVKAIPEFYFLRLQIAPGPL